MLTNHPYAQSCLFTALNAAPDIFEHLLQALAVHAHLDPRVEKYVCEKLGLKPAALSTQIIQRDRHAEFMTVLALIASSIDRWARASAPGSSAHTTSAPPGRNRATKSSNTAV